MKARSSQLVPVLICTCVLALVCLLELVSIFSGFKFFQRIEWISYDWRARLATKASAPYATNLAAVFLDEETLNWLEEGGLGRPVSWPYPKYVHARIVRELTEEGAAVVGFDILLTGARPDDVNNVAIPDKSGTTLIGSSGGVFVQQLREASNVILAVTPDITLADFYRTNAWAIAHIEAVPDSDGVLRRARPYFDHSAQGRIWHLGIALAARIMDLDLSKAIIEPDRIVLIGPKGLRRVIPLDHEGNFLIDWRLAWNDPRMFSLSYGQVLTLDKLRHEGSRAEYLEYVNDLRVTGKKSFVGDNPLTNKLVVIGSIMVGRNVTDRGSTPLSEETFLFSKYWNIANSVIMGRFVRESSFGTRILMILLMGIVGGVLTWRLRTLAAFLSVVAVAAAYLAIGVVLYVHYVYWLPMVLPIFAAALTYGGLTTYRVGFEQNEQRRVKRIFSKIVSPNIVNELLSTENLALGGARRRITVFFSDVRGFTEMTDSNQAKAEEYAKNHNLTGAAAENYFNQRAREDLETVNLYLGLVADITKKHGGTLDKYIGDCVMSFWGAPTADDKHALGCVRAAIDAQRAIYAVNTERAAENKRRQEENVKRVENGQEPLPLLPILALGAGINTGIATVGLMGSEAHIVNYTVFGREVNLASRLEGVSGRGRIFISDATYRDILRDDPALAATFLALAPSIIKGFRDPIKMYEVPWKQSEAAKNGRV